MAALLTQIPYKPASPWNSAYGVFLIMQCIYKNPNSIINMPTHSQCTSNSRGASQELYLMVCKLSHTYLQPSSSGNLCTYMQLTPILYNYANECNHTTAPHTHCDGMLRFIKQAQKPVLVCFEKALPTWDIVFSSSNRAFPPRDIVSFTPDTALWFGQEGCSWFIII